MSMRLQLEISGLFFSLQRCIKHRRLKQEIAASDKLWPSALSLLLICITVVAVLLLPYDPVLSRIVVASHFWLIDILRRLTNLVLAAPYIALFLLIIVVSLVARWRIAALPACFNKSMGKTRIYHRLGTVIGHSLFAILAILTAGLIVNILKYIIGRPRPFLIDTVGAYALKPFDYGHLYVSFPSGHSCTAAVLATLVSLWFPRCRFAAYAVMVLLAFSRIAVQAHYPTDVLIGFTIGTVSTLILSRFFAQGDLLFYLRQGRLMPVSSLQTKS